MGVCFSLKGLIMHFVVEWDMEKMHISRSKCTKEHVQSTQYHRKNGIMVSGNVEDLLICLIFMPLYQKIGGI
jgi:hypothetical protein